MSSQTLRSLSRARPELGNAGHALRGYFRQFSTTQSQLDETSSSSDPNANTNANARPSARQRTRAAASEINALQKNRTSSLKPLDPSAAPAQPRVIDVRSLPRGGGMFRGRGGLRGRGSGGQNAAATGPRAASPSSGSRFAGANRGRTSAIGAGRGGRAGGGGGGATRGGRGGRPGGAAGRAAKAKQGGDKAAGGAAAGPRGKRQDPFERMDAQEQQFDDAMRFGTKTTYAPSLTKEGLAAFVPAMPSTREGHLAAVMENLSILGGRADPVGVPQGLQARSYADEMEANGARFFADVKAREAAEAYLQEKRKLEAAAEGEQQQQQQQQKPIIQDVDEFVKKAIMESAVEGKHEKPAFATDAVGISRSWHLRAGTYTQRDVESFEKKLTSLLGVAKARA